jgi:hypothetical protein
VDRRKFLFRAGAVIGASSLKRAAFADALPQVSGEVWLHDDPAAPQIPLNYVGLSYELAQLSDPTFFSVANRNLVSYFRLLSARGVLRLGGNTSEFCWLRVNASTPEPKLHVPTGNLDANWMPHRLFAIETQAIDALADFLNAAGWRLIYGVNFCNSTPQRAADEAAYVAEMIGDRLEYFQIGNEPDLYTKASNGTRPPGWNFADYVREWSSFAEAIAARVPHARFGGPDVAASSDWVTQFSEQVPASIAPRMVALTGHYYAEGPPDDPRVTIERLLAGNPKIAVETNAIVASAKQHERIYRMTEGNSCYRGGKPGMSDAFAAALWAGDYMLELASLGCAGVNLHGGSSAYLTAGLGDHTPGMEVAKTPQAVHAGFYSPIQSEPGGEPKAMPVFYGMMLANQFIGHTMLRTECDLKGVGLTSYAARRGESVKVALFNKDEHAGVLLSIRSEHLVRTAAAWRLQAPSLDSTVDVSLASAEIQDHAQWNPHAEVLEVRNGVTHLIVPAGSAALLYLD